MTIHLVRHAHAGSRSTWTGDDAHRPLTDRGRAQAETITEAITTELAGSTAGGIPVMLLSSPYVRCVQTLEPLAARVHGEVVPADRLAEGVSGQAALGLLLDAIDGGTPVVACSHGDVIPAIVATALGLGATLDGDAAPRKAARYRFDVTDGRVIHITHVPRPEV